MQKLRKAFVVGVMAVTVLSVSMLTVPFQVGATASAGDLIKMDGLSSVYYLGADGKRYVFPNEATYFSWYSDFSGVVTIPQSELEKYSLGANVTMRPGTKLVKITTDPKVYAVEPDGKLVHVGSEAAAISLFGANWAKRVVDIADAFFTNYEVTGTQVSATAYPTGSLVKFGGADVYYIDATGKARKVASEAAFLANRFKWSDVIDSSLSLPTLGAEITGAEGALTDTSSGAGGVAGAGTGLSVSLASDTPEAGNVVKGALSDMTEIKLTASNDGDVTVEGITFKLYGLGDYDNMIDVALYQDGVKLSTSKNVNSDREVTLNISGGLKVKAGETENVLVRGKIDDDSGYYALGIAAASSVTTNGAAVTGSFPIKGNNMSAIAVTIGEVNITNVDGTGDTAQMGEDDVLLASFTLGADGEDVIWESAKLQNTGDDGVASNLRIVVEGEDIDTAEIDSDDYVSFDMGNYLIEDGDSIDVEVRGDINITDIDDEVTLGIDELDDFSFVGQDYGAGITMAGAITNSITVGVDAGEVSLDIDKTAQADKVRPGTDNVILATIEMVSKSEDATIEEIDGSATNFTITSDEGAGASQADLDNIQLRVVGGSVYDLDSTYAAGVWTLSTDEEISLPVGETVVMKIEADVADDITDGVELTTVLKEGALTITGDESDADITEITPSSVESKAVTIEDSSIDWSTEALSDKTVVEGSKNIKIYQATVEAGDSSLVEITSVKLTNQLVGGLGLNDDNIDQMVVKLNGEVIQTASDKISGDGTAAAYVTLNKFDSAKRIVPAGETYTFEVYADFTSDVTAGSFELGVEAAGDIVAKDLDGDEIANATIDTANTSRVITMTEQGNLKVDLKTTHSKADADSYLLAGTEIASGKYLAEIIFSADNEDVEVTTLNLATEGTALRADLNSVQLIKEDGTVAFEQALESDGSVEFTFDSGELVIPANKSVSYFLGADSKAIDDTDAGTATFRREVQYSIADVEAKGVSSSAEITMAAESVDAGTDLEMGEFDDTDLSKTATISGAVLTAITNPMSDANLTGGNGKTLGKYTFVFDNGDNYDTAAGEELKAQMKSLRLTVSAGGATTTNLKVYVEGSTAKVNGIGVAPGVWGFDLTGLTALGKTNGTVNLIVTGDVTTDTEDYIQTSIANLATGDFTYNGNNGSLADFSNPLLDITEVNGATLSN